MYCDFGQTLYISTVTVASNVSVATNALNRSFKISSDADSLSTYQQCFWPYVLDCEAVQKVILSTLSRTASNVPATINNGIGVERNFDADLDHDKRAANQHDDLADLQVEDCFLESIDMKRDPKMADCWSDGAAKYGERQAFFTHSIRYARRLGVMPLYLLFSRLALLLVSFA